MIAFVCRGNLGSPQNFRYGVAQGQVGSGKCVVVPDASAIMRQADVIESATAVGIDLLFLQTVLREVRRRSADCYERVTAILTSDANIKHAGLFSNEHRVDSYVERNLAGESEIEYDFKCVVSAKKWLSSHWKAHSLSPILLTDSTAFADLYTSAGLTNVVLVRDLLNDYPELRDKYAEHEAETAMQDTEGAADGTTQGNSAPLAKKPRFQFPSYIPERRANAGVKGGRLFKGTYRPSQFNFLEAYVSANVKNGDRVERTKILLYGREHQNRAIDGDIVVVELLHESDWAAPSNRAIEQDDIDFSGGEHDDRSADKSHDAEAGTVQKGKTDAIKRRTVPTGRVVAVAKRAWRPYCGAISGASYTGGDRALFVPADRKIPKIRVRSRRMTELLGQRLIVVVDRWDRDSIYPSGHVVREIGNSGDKEAETEVILVEHGIPTRKFSDAAMACLPGDDWKVTEDHVKSRWDLRDVTVCSVDPPGCTDIDDALHFRRLNEDEVEVGVHIADVTAFVAHDSALDREAAERGTTVYLVDRRIEMLPSLLSGNLCSLRSDVERLAFSALIRMKNDGTVVASEFGRSVIRSSASLTYQQAQERIDAARNAPGTRPDVSVDDVTTGLLGLADIASKLRQRRMQAGALTLASPEVRFKISELTDSVTDAHVYEIRETNRMVEEYMLLANVVVAEKTLKHFPHCAMLRRHPKPSEEMFEPLITAASSVGYTVDASNSRALNDSLATIDSDAKDKGDNYLGTLLRIMATRCMTQAVYFSSGEVADPEFLHYGLAAPVYTHFTSPIRRYADVLVHRLLSACLGFASLPMSLQDSKRMNELAGVINERHHNAQFAARASSALHTVLLFKDKTLDEEARIVRVFGNGLVVLVPRYGVEGFVQLDEDRQPQVDALQQSLSTKDGKVYKVLSSVRVRIRVDSAPERRDRVLYELVE